MMRGGKKLKLEATEGLTSNLALISEWNKRNLTYFNAPKTQYHHLTTRLCLLHKYTLPLNNKQLSFLPHRTSLVCPELKIVIGDFIALGKLGSSKSSGFHHLKHNFSSYSCLHMGVVRPCLEYSGNVWEDPLIQLFWTD